METDDPMFTIVFHAGQLSTNDVDIALAHGVVSAMNGRSATIHGSEGEPVVEITVDHAKNPDEPFHSARVHFCGSEEQARELKLQGHGASVPAEVFGQCRI